MPNLRNKNSDRGGTTPVDGVARSGKYKAPEYTLALQCRCRNMRPQVEGRVLAINVDVGILLKGQLIAQIDDASLGTALNAEQSRTGGAESGHSKSSQQCSNKWNKHGWNCKHQSDSRRQQELFREGAIAEQTAEQARTELKTSAQALRAALQQVRTEQQAAAAQDRVNAQQTVVAQARAILCKLTSPISVVTQRVTEEGNLVQP